MIPFSLQPEKTATLRMQRRCCGMHTSLFPTHRIRSIGQVRISSALSPLLIYLFIEVKSFPSYLGLKSLILLDSSLVFWSESVTLTSAGFRLKLDRTCISVLLLSLSWSGSVTTKSFPKSIPSSFGYFSSTLLHPCASRSRWDLLGSRFGMRT